MSRKLWSLVFAVTAGILVVTGTIYAMESSITVAAEEDVLPDQQGALRKAAIWLVRTHQNDDGGYSSFSSGANDAPSSIGGTVDAILAIAASGNNPAALFPGKTDTLVGYIMANPAQVAEYAGLDGSQAGKLVLALTAAAADPRDVDGFNAVDALKAQQQPDGSFGVTDVYKHSLAILGLVSVGEPVPAASLQWIVDTQAADGSWDDGFGTLGNPDATAMAIMALLASEQPVDDPVVVAAREFLADVQLPDGSWEYGTGFGGNANTTALVIQALSALGEDWYSATGPWAQNGISPLEALLSFQSASGAFHVDYGQGPADDFYSTVQSLLGVAGLPYPLPARFEAARMGLVCLDNLQDEQSGGWEQFAGYGVNAAGTSRAIEAIHSAGGDPQDDRWTTAGAVNAVDALEQETPDYVAGGLGGRVGVVMQGVVAAADPYAVSDFAGLDLPLLMSGYLSPTGEYDSTAFGISSQGEAMLGLIVADEPVDPTAVDFLLDAQNDGDWGSPDGNGLALNVLGRLNEQAPAESIDVLHAGQLADGGWGYDLPSNPNSTSEVVQG
ncbi:MAG: prenyltransferase/squalene oxidase repeat-containing protein [Chloroflexota bacterium]